MNITEKKILEPPKVSYQQNEFIVPFFLKEKLENKNILLPMSKFDY